MSDIPPYSPLRFEIDHSQLAVVYGEDAVVQVRVVGGELESPVQCLVRDREQGRTESLACYSEGTQSFAKKFENTRQPVEFAFTCGRARSDWFQLDVLLQPRVASASVKISSPEYTGMAMESFSLDSNEIRAAAGSIVELVLHSNRPLGGGLLEVRSKDTDGNEQTTEVSGELVGHSSVCFSWTAQESSDLVAHIHDVRFTKAASPFAISLNVKKDEVPTISVNSPQSLLLATPKSKVPFELRVEDDFGIKSVKLQRTLLGFRDRGKLIAEGQFGKSYHYENQLDLAQLGVEAEQTLEFYFEAQDHHPNKLGIGVSDLVKVVVISEEEYAERIRMKTQLEEFTIRYQALAHAMKQARNAIGQLHEAIDSGDPDSIKSALEQAKKHLAESKELANKIGDDFEAFAMEKRLRDVASALGKQADEALKQLNQFGEGSSPAEMSKGLDELGSGFKKIEKKVAQVRQDAEKVKQLGEVMKQSAEFMRIYKAQESLAERTQLMAKEIAMGEMTNAGNLANLGRLQQKNRQALAEMKRELLKHAGNLDDEFAQMAADVQQFIELLDRLDIDNAMKAAETAAEKGQSIDAAANSILALSLMEQLLQQKNSFCSMCKSRAPRFTLPQDVAMTMQQMLEALMCQSQRGQGNGNSGGAGGGGGGSGSDGYSVMGNSLSIPMYGPDRAIFSPQQFMSAHGGAGGKGALGTDGVKETNRIEIEQASQQSQAGPESENVPDRYKDAVKRYFVND
ncbi:hypothetical protein [Persicirhabdus sediminis]|uniref:Uncharacterized protein n=1 Tax=Persicirhabdus sediminis TaxID=454144 RepID=A0A8J7MAM1_9BACT|nr:hypothetical protein [Persicirhabdus sediminis]MBK1789947.1 hypothetical protein [Persicirhabdus sediminis]